MAHTERKESEFLIQSDVLENLRPGIESAAQMIQKAVKEGRPIILKHHADCDGYIAGIAIEMAITHILSKRNREARWRYLRRMPSRVPFYDYVDVLKDLTNYDRDLQAGNIPLLIIADSGSSQQDLLALKKAKQYGLQIIIVDHHDPFIVSGKSAAGLIADILINPHLANGDSNLCAGMLASELARFISEDWIETKYDHLPAIAGIGDRSSGKENDEYLALAKKEGYDKEMLVKLAKCVDFEAFHIGFMESDIVEDLLFADMERQKELASPLIEEIGHREQKVVETFRKYSSIEKINDISLAIARTDLLVDLGSYPPQGKCVGLFFDTLKPTKAIVLGIGDGSITVRTNIPGFDLNKLIIEMKTKFPYAQIEGGGHKVAGTLHFVGAAESELVDYIKSHLET